MSRVAYVNGSYLPHRRAAVHIEDRGYQFADGVYEVIAIQGGQLVDKKQHLDRLAKSLRALAMEAPMGKRALNHVMNEVVRRNRVVNGMLYLQVTRGVAPRDHAFPLSRKSSLVMTARATSGPAPHLLAQGWHVITVPDIRWKRCDIKTVSLLPNVLAKQQAKDAGAFEALQVDEEGFITEGSAANAWIITADGVLVTRPADAAILDGITRRTVIALASRAELRFDERPFSGEEAKAAAEAFLTGTTAFVMPIAKIDDQPVGDSKPGPFTKKLLADYAAHVATGGKAL